ncbi:MAG TPA: twin-arginine translocase TatA/TatE family subunit [Solirubrobacteraceae bacterium]|nr:twin-arginine translocase TatA/TatE family subunit [Solirubrobacteraceae bacterium]
MGLDNPLHILLLLLVVLLVFGAKRLPEIGRSLGEGMRGFKESISGNSQETLAPAPPAVTPVAAPEAAPVAVAPPAPPAPPAAAVPAGPTAPLQDPAAPSPFGG